MRVIVSYSGGKDSQATLIWAVRKYGAGRVTAVFCDTKWEHPVTIEHIRETTRQLGVELVTLTSDKVDGFEGLCVKMRCVPVATRRACTSELKIKPMIDWVLRQEDNLLILQGIRAKESASRARMLPECSYFLEYFSDDKKNLYRKKAVKEWCGKHDASLLRPIFEWTAQDVIDYILNNGQQPNPLYRKGVSRVGCFPCIMSRLAEVRVCARDPEMRERLILLEKNVNDAGNKNYAGFFVKGTIPKWACRTIGDGTPTAEEVMDYVTRNDDVPSLFGDDESLSCMSLYHGLCE